MPPHWGFYPPEELETTAPLCLLILLPLGGLCGSCLGRQSSHSGAVLSSSLRGRNCRQCVCVAAGQEPVHRRSLTCWNPGPVSICYSIREGFGCLPFGFFSILFVVSVHLYSFFHSSGTQNQLNTKSNGQVLKL